jgi:hypothetical protein
MLLTKAEQKQFAMLINALIDIPLVPEEMEQVIFEHGVAVIDRALEDTLPAAFHELLRDSGRGIDKDHAKAFADRLIEATNKKFDMPYLNEEQEAQLLGTIIHPLVKAMTSGKKLDDLLPALQAASGV